MANQIYDKLDELAIKEYSRTRLGGADSVVLAEMFPDCLNRLSPDTTDHPHVHRILMLADTKVSYLGFYFNFLWFFKCVSIILLNLRSVAGTP